MFNFTRKDTEFFDLFVESAKYLHEGAIMTDAVIMDHTKAVEKVKEIIDLEHSADRVNEKILEKLNLTFITPLDREDIYSLANELNDGVDILHGALQRIVMYRVGEAMGGAVSMAKLLVSSSEELVTAFSLLENVKKNQTHLLDAVHLISDMESEGDRIYRHEIAFLFETEQNPIELIKWKDILENLEDTLDHFEKISNMIRGVVMKYA